MAEHKNTLLMNYIESLHKEGIHDKWGQKLGGYTDFKIIFLLTVLKINFHNLSLPDFTVHEEKGINVTFKADNCIFLYDASH